MPNSRANPSDAIPLVETIPNVERDNLCTKAAHEILTLDHSYLLGEISYPVYLERLTRIRALIAALH